MTSDACQAGEDNGRVSLRSGPAEEGLPLVRRQGEHLGSLSKAKIHWTKVRDTDTNDIDTCQEARGTPWQFDRGHGIRT